jgi:uncharacterized protein
VTVEIRPLGDRCNLRCTYCYENPLRDHNLPGPPDYGKIKRILKEYDSDFTIFGGEPLLLPLPRLEELFKFGYENWKKNGIQTNGTLITDKHIKLFKEYNVGVGFSIDGPGELNDARKLPRQGMDATRAMTERSNQNLLRCLNAGVRASLICTLSKKNTGKFLTTLLDWFKMMAKGGLTHVRLHFLENDDADDLLPTHDHLVAAMGALYLMHQEKRLKFDMFDEMESKLRGKHQGCCVYQGCDPMNTPAVRGIGAQGEPTNCGRINKEGIDFLKADIPTQMRDWVLKETPQQEGGCRGCAYWYACRGNCPGTGIGGDWRNRTAHCETLKAIFNMILTEKKFKLLESEVDRIACGHGDSHGDHQDNRPHGDHHDYARLEVRHAKNS